MDTELIILRTVNYSETSLILHCLTPEYGRLSVLARGAKKLTSKKFPEVGLFRVYNAALNKPATGDLHILNSIELIAENDRLASTPSLIEFAGSISRFALSGNFEELPCPVFYDALINCLQNIEQNSIPINAWISRLLVIYLMEQGLFPEIQLSRQQKTIITVLLDPKSDNLETLDLKEDQWREMKNWALKTALFAEIELPQTPCFTCC